MPDCVPQCALGHCVYERWCVTKAAKIVCQMLCDKAVHDTQGCWTHGVFGKLLVCKVMCDRWCVTKLNVTELLVTDAV